MHLSSNSAPHPLPPMPIHTVPVAFPTPDPMVLNFIEHCMEHWRDVDVCTDAHVALMKHLVRSIFGLPYGAPLVGISFCDRTLAMLCPPLYTAFYTLTHADGWTAAYVRAEGFVPHWGLETGFWDGLAMAEGAVLGEENVGPAEDG